jgi:hypothetical protein
MLSITVSWLLDTSTRLALFAITIAFLVNHVYEMIAYATALQVYSLVNPFGPSATIHGIQFNMFIDKAHTAANQILDIFNTNPPHW